MDHNAKYPDTATNQAGLEIDSRPQYTEYDPALGGAYTAQPRNDELKGRKILGLSIGVFWAIIVVCALAIGGGVGGGVGAGLAAQKRCDESQVASTTQTVTQTILSTPGATIPTTTTSRPTSLASAAPSSPCQTNLAVNGTSVVPAQWDGKPYVLSTGAQTFRIHCDTNWPGGGFYGNPELRDIMTLWTPDLESCMAACASYNIGYLRALNEGVNVGGGMCRAVALIVADQGSCWLKNGTGKVQVGRNSGGEKVDSAVLVV